jgi:hypothetical protein
MGDSDEAAAVCGAGRRGGCRSAGKVFRVMMRARAAAAGAVRRLLRMRPRRFRRRLPSSEAAMFMQGNWLQLTCRSGGGQAQEGGSSLSIMMVVQHAFLLFPPVHNCMIYTIMTIIINST